jgi:hypothetical protein
MFQYLEDVGSMPDGRQVTSTLVLQASRPLLAEALGQLLACAERGEHPDGILRDIRTLMGEHGLLHRYRAKAERSGSCSPASRCVGGMVDLSRPF